ncbi:protein kinase, partial [Candidatus Woesearchaeota archaeon]|nr:protein kinase [Candidatus Woesearchaeota archaeon]
RANDPKSMRTQVVGGPVPADHIYHGKELADIVDNTVMAYAMNNGIEYFAPLNEDFQDGGMARGYRGVASHSDNDEEIEITSEHPVFIKAVTGGNMANYLQEAEKHKDICSKAPSAAKLYFSHVENTKEGAAILILGMEDIVGENVERYIDSNPALKWWYDVEDTAQKKDSLRDLLVLVRQMTDAVDEVHAAGYVHRDVKPSNFMRTKDGSVKSLDFASALKIGARPDMKEGFHGTPEYCSLEHLTGEADVRMDVFSLGCVLYEFMTGRPPYTAAAATARKKKSDDVSQEKLGQEITTRLLSAMINNERYQNSDAEESLRELQDVCDDLKFIVEHATSVNINERFDSCYALSSAISCVIDKLDANRLFSGTVNVCKIDESLYKKPTGEVAPITALPRQELSDADVWLAALRKVSEPDT